MLFLKKNCNFAIKLPNAQTCSLTSYLASLLRTQSPPGHSHLSQVVAAENLDDQFLVCVDSVHRLVEPVDQLGYRTLSAH